MKKAMMFCLLASFSAIVFAGKGVDVEADMAERAVTHSAQWSTAFAKLGEKHDLTLDQTWLVDRALQLGSVAQFDMSMGKANWLETHGEELKELMAEARMMLEGNAYVDLLLAMGPTQNFLVSVAVIPVGACDCNSLCDCNDVAPRYSRCQNTPCLLPWPTPSGWPTKLCQYQ